MSKRRKPKRRKPSQPQRIPAEALDRFYLAELVLQAEFALRAYGEIEQRSSGSASIVVFAFIQLMLGCAANVSKLLFPTDRATQETRERCLRLRAKLSVDQDSPLADRTARNYVDHFDEKLDEHLGRTGGVLTHRLVLQGTATPTIRLDDGSEHQAKHLQLFEAPSRTLVLSGHRLELGPLADAIVALQRAAVVVQPDLATRGWDLTCLQRAP